jgi:hypothetical protein
MSQRVLPGTNQPTAAMLRLIPRYFSTSSSILRQLILRQRSFIQVQLHPLSTPLHTRPSFLCTSLLLLPSKHERPTLQFQSKNPPFLPLICPKRLPFLPCFVVREQTRFYFDERQNLYDIYKPFLIPFIQTLTEDILAPLATEEASAHCLDVVSWLLGPSAVARPAVPYLASVPISFPLIGLTRLPVVQYLPVIVCHIANLTPSPRELRSRLSGATGHSQLEGILYPCNAEDTLYS